MELIKPEEEFVARKIEYPDIAQMIKQKIISDKNKIHACNSLWASEAAHDCARYLVYQQCDWDRAKETEDSLLLVFHEGNIQEDQLILEIQKAGIKARDLQIAIKIAEANISGKLDLIAEVEGSDGVTKCIPIEIKSMSDMVYNSVNTVEDLKKYPWTRKYYGQVQIYCKNDNWFFPECYLLAKNKSTGAIKLIKDFDGGNTIKFNQEYWDWMINRGKKINENVFSNKYIQMEIAKEKALLTGKDTKKEQTIKNKIAKLESKITYPERIKYDLKVCKGCKYEHICITDLTSEIGSQITNESIIEAVGDYVKAKKEQEKFKEADKKYKTCLATLKEIFPLEDNIYFAGEKYIVETKKRKVKDSEYLAFDVSEAEGVD